MTMITPDIKKTGAASERLNATSWEVTVVPMLAPRITPAACDRFIRPAFTKLTTMTVEALDDWMIAVKKMPTSIPENRLVVKNSRIPLSLAPAAFSRPSLINFIPYKKSPRPPAIGNRKELIAASLVYIKFNIDFTNTLLLFYFKISKETRKTDCHFSLYKV